MVFPFIPSTMMIRRGRKRKKIYFNILYKHMFFFSREDWALNILFEVNKHSKEYHCASVWGGRERIESRLLSRHHKSKR
jgi:hypothetical protein